jgi:uncharacterized protein (TIGR01777 family)
LKIAIAGSRGFVGSELVPYLEEKGFEVFRLIRGVQNSNSNSNSNASGTPGSGHAKQILWNPDLEFIDVDALNANGIDAIVNLAGDNVHQRWTRSSKKRISMSRVKATKLLGKAIRQLEKRPIVFISASGISYYHNIEPKMAVGGNYAPGKNEEYAVGVPLIDESGPPGSGFLSELCQEWESATKIAGNEQSGVRIVNLRIGIALGGPGGVLGKLVPLFRAGLGGKWGSGLQFMSWIAIDDLVRIIHFALTEDSVEGPINAVAPTPVTNLEFSKTLGRILSRPTIFTVPALLARWFFGREWVDSTLLANYRIRPGILMERGFKFQYPELEPFLRKELTDSTFR